MNDMAVLVGSFYGAIAIIAAYVVSMVASGLFARSFYRIYARVLIGICSIMMFAPLLKWMSPHPISTRILLTLTGYLAAGVLAYGVVRFNREYMKTVFLGRSLTAYFTFGTLANAMVITLVILHVAACPEGLRSRTFGLAHYAPLLMLLAALVFHTDIYLKAATDSARQLSRFTFVGYAIALAAVLISTLPFISRALKSLALAGPQDEFLANFSCAQTLLLAILVFGALAWKLGTIPPLYVMIAAICAEYYVLVTQWCIRGVGEWPGLGPSVFALASLPLLAGLGICVAQLRRLDRKREAIRRIAEGGQSAAESTPSSKVITPVLVVYWCLAAVMVGATLWTRFDIRVQGWSPAWLAATFAAMAIYELACTVMLREPLRIYAAAILLALAALIGIVPAAGTSSALILASLALGWCVLSVLGSAVSLKRPYQSALADVGTISGVVSLALVACRQFSPLGGEGPYNFGPVSSVYDLISLAVAAAAMVLATRQYRSRLPMYGVVLAAILVNPMLSAGIGLAVCMAGELIHAVGKKRTWRTDDQPLPFMNSGPLPFSDTPPELYARPLSQGTLPLALFGLALSVSHIVRLDLTPSAIAGTAASAIVLGVLTRTMRWVWLYALALACACLAIHAEACRWIGTPTTVDNVSRHILLLTVISLVGWLIAISYSAWCDFWLRRVAEEREEAIRQRKSFYAGVLYGATLVAGTVATASLGILTLSRYSAPVPAFWVPVATGICAAVLFALCGATYRSSAPLMLSMAAFCLTSYNIVGLCSFGYRSTYDALALAAIALICAVKSTAIRRLFPAPDSSSPQKVRRFAEYANLWVAPLELVSIFLPFVAVAHALNCWGVEAVQSLVLIVLYLAAAVWLLSTRSDREGLSTILARIAGQENPSQRSGQMQRDERIVLTLLTIGMLYFAVHATAQTVLASHFTSAREQILACHVLVAGVVSMLGWAIASVCSAQGSRRSLRDAAVEASSGTEQVSFYAPILYLTTTCAAIVNLAALLWHAISFRTQACEWLNLSTSLILALFFALAGVVYRTRLCTYLSLIAITIGAGMFVSAVPLGPIGGVENGAVWTIVGLAAVAVACALWSGLNATEQQSGTRSPSNPLPDRFLPLLESDWRRRWAVPLAEYSLLISFVGVALATTRLGHETVSASLIAFLTTSCICFVNARLYRHPVLTYLGAAALWASAYAGLAEFGFSADYCGPAVAGLALAVWAASYAAERRGIALRNAAIRPDPESDSFDIVAVYEKPLLRSAVAMALAAAIHALAAYAMGRSLQLQLLSTAGAAVTLLLAARSTQLLQRFASARAMVYVACVTACGGIVAASVVSWGMQACVPTAAIMAILLAIAGLMLQEAALRFQSHSPAKASMLQLYGEPVTRFATVFPAALIGLGITRTVPTPFASTVLNDLALALITSGIAYAILTRATRLAVLLYPSVILTSLAISAEMAARLPLSLGEFLFANAVVFNLWVCLARWTRRYRDRVNLVFGLDAAECDKPFYWWPFAATAALLVGPTIYFAANVLHGVAITGSTWPWQVTPFLAFLLFFHILYLERRRVFVHALIGSGLLATLWLAAVSNWAITPDLALICSGLFWGGAAVLLMRPAGEILLSGFGLKTEAAERKELAAAAIQWVYALWLIAAAITIPLWIMMHPVIPNTCLTLVAVAAGCLLASYLGRIDDSWWTPARTLRDAMREIGMPSEPVLLEVLGAILFLPAILSAIAFVCGADHALSSETLSTTLPLAGLATSLLSLAYVGAARRISRSHSLESGTGDAAAALLNLAVVFTVFAFALTALAAATTAPAVSVAASLVVLSAICLSMSWFRQQEPWVYLTEGFAAAIYFYVRHALLGHPFGPDFVKAFAIIGLAFMLFGLNIVVSRSKSPKLSVFLRPSFYSALFLPFLLPAMTPLGPDTHATLSLVVFSAAAFYALIARRERLNWAIWLSVILFNIAVYLWVPQLSRSSHLLQLYVIPGALSVLILAQLHRHELNRKTLTSVRYAAAGVILAVSSLEALVSSEMQLLHFVLVLCLSLCGTVAGISLKVRPFIYVSLAFLVVNVLGQLGLQFQRQSDVLLRAGILIGVGFGVIAVMIYFNVRREQIIRRYRTFLEDSRWE